MEGASQLLRAVVLCDEDEVVAVLKTASGAASAADAEAASGYTALHHAAHYGHKPLILLLLEAGANV